MDNFEEIPQPNPEISAEPDLSPAKKVSIPVKRGDERYDHYFKKYSEARIVQLNINNIVALNRHGVFLYEVPSDNGEEKLNHVIWIYNNPDQELPVYEVIPTESWTDVANQPALIDRINVALIESSNQATNFYEWNTRPRGFVIEGSKNFGLEVGNIAGIRVSYEEIKPLIDVIKSGDTEGATREQKHLAASIVHELTHLERNVGFVSQVVTEIASHISQFIFDPHNNEVFNRQLAYSLRRIEGNRREGKKQKPLNLYDRARFAALLIVAGMLSEHSEIVKSALKKDTDPHKLTTLRSLGTLIGEPEQKYCVEEVLPTIMRLDNAELLQIIRDIESRYDIRQDVIEIE